MHDLGLEWAVLELISTDPRTPEELERLRVLMADPACHHGELIEQAIRHKLLFRLAALVVSWNSLLPATVRSHLREARRLNRHRILLFREAASGLCRQLTERDISFAFTKGMVLESTIYRGEWTRRVGDIDLMIAPRDRERVADALAELGYRNGAYDLDTDELTPLSRPDAIRYALHKDHLPHFLRIIPDVAVPFIDIDVANSLTWNTSEWTIPVDAALNSVEWFDIDGVRCPRMRWSFGFLFTILHLFREAWFEDNIGDGSDITLAALADVYLLWKYHGVAIRRENFAELVRTHGLERPVTWVLANVDQTLGSDMIGQLDLRGYADDAWLRSVRGRDGTAARFTVGMRERLRARVRSSLIRPIT